MTLSSHRNNNINVIKVKCFAGTCNQFKKDTPGRVSHPGVVLLVSFVEAFFRLREQA